MSFNFINNESEINLSYKNSFYTPHHNPSPDEDLDDEDLDDEEDNEDNNSVPSRYDDDDYEYNDDDEEDGDDYEDDNDY